MFDDIKDFIDNISFIGWAVIICFLILSLGLHKVIELFKKAMEE